MALRLARIIGSGLAQFQNAIDEMADAGFRMLKKAGTKKERIVDLEQPRSLTTAKRLGKSALRFFGEAGESYYQKYDELKGERRRS